MIKKLCLVLLAMAPIASVSFAAKSALNVAQIRGGTAYDTELQGSVAESYGNGGGGGQKGTNNC
jgi:hypothetical protein